MGSILRISEHSRTMLAAGLLSLFCLSSSQAQGLVEEDRFLTGLVSGLDCCSRTSDLCSAPCAGQDCTKMCEVKCGFLGSIVCTPIACSVGNAAECVSTSACGDVYTQVGSKCMKVVAGPSNYLDA